MTNDDPASGRPARQTVISGNTNSGFIAGGDIHGVTLSGGQPLGAAPPSVSPPVASDQVLRILFLAANPQDAPALRFDAEIREIDLALRQGDFRDRFDLRQQFAVRPTDLQTALLRHRPHILHFSGHGETDGLFFEDEAGRMQSVQGGALARILAVFKKQIRCVVLNTCHTREQAETLAQEIDCVIGMSTAIGDRAAVSFSSAFYQALAFGSSVETAFQLGCAQIDLAGLNEGSTPQLIAYGKEPGEIVFFEA